MNKNGSVGGIVNARAHLSGHPGATVDKITAIDTGTTVSTSESSEGSTSSCLSVTV